MDSDIISQNYLQVRERIDEATSRVDREVGSVRLVVVTKTQAVKTVQKLVEVGAHILGENYADEALPKIEALRENTALQWHMIGHIQSRKAKIVAEHFHYIHSLDRIKVARLLDRFAAEQGRRIPVLLECNVSGEETKFGLPAWQEDSWSMLNGPVAEFLDMENLEVRGLMTLAPYAENAELSRPYFRRLRKLSGYLQTHFPQTDWHELSMGMSHDFEVAIEEGATWVRVGTAILGERS